MQFSFKQYYFFFFLLAFFFLSLGGSSTFSITISPLCRGFSPSPSDIVRLWEEDAGSDGEVGSSPNCRPAYLQVSHFMGPFGFEEERRSSSASNFILLDVVITLEGGFVRALILIIIYVWF